MKKIVLINFYIIGIILNTQMVLRSYDKGDTAFLIIGCLFIALCSYFIMKVAKKK
jgi:hypothetical protein